VVINARRGINQRPLICHLTFRGRKPSASSCRLSAFTFCSLGAKRVHFGVQPSKARKLRAKS
jgi:hypothetical protein